MNSLIIIHLKTLQTLRKKSTGGSGIKLNHELIAEDLEDILMEYTYFQKQAELTIQLQNNNQIFY